MRNVATTILAGLGVLALAGAAVAAEREIKVMNVALPDGVLQIRYAGDVAPRVIVVPARAGAADRSAQAAAAAQFVMLDRLFLDMQRRSEAMLRETAALAAGAPLAGRSFNLPAGSVRHSFVSAGNGRIVCGRTVRIMSRGPDKPAKVEETVSGNCGTVTGSAAARKESGKPAHAAPHPRDTI